VGAVAFAILFIGFAHGCASAPPLVAFRPDHIRIAASFDPGRHTLQAQAALDLSLARGSFSGFQTGRCGFDLLLHPDLTIGHLVAAGATIEVWKAIGEETSQAAEVLAKKYRIILAESAETLSLFVAYEGRLHEDVTAGEQPGQLHNKSVRAHIGEEGIFLTDDGYWYPRPLTDLPAEPSLAHFTFVADPVAGIELVVSAECDILEQTDRLTWRSPYPTAGLTVVGGPHVIHEDRCGAVRVAAHLKPGQEKHARGLIATVCHNLQRYQPLIGLYPASEYRVVDNFFSSGFAFPMFTLLGSAVIEMGERSWTAHGYLDHELLHSWWGNGIHVDPRDGDWSEALASYAANYYGYVLDGNEEEARRKRRNCCHFLSRLEPKEDQPLGTFGRENGAGRAIGYDKGAMVFHMLARKVGQDVFWRVMRRFTSEYVGRTASWADIRRLFEAETGEQVAPFFGQWVRRPGAPLLQIDRAARTLLKDAPSRLNLHLSQGEPAFELDVPIRIFGAGTEFDTVVRLGGPAGSFDLPVSFAPESVELDPEYHVLRKVPAAYLVPTTAATRSGNALAAVVPAEPVPPAYPAIQALFEASFAENERTVLYAGAIPPGALASRCLLILGQAARDPYVAAYLSAIEFPVRWTERGFAYEDTTYADPGHALLCTVRHPGVPGGGVTVVYGNSEAAIPKPATVPMYDRSLVIFHDRVPVVRRDFEPRFRVRVETHAGSPASP